MGRDKNPNMSELEKEIASVKVDAITEEQVYADNNYEALDKELAFYISQIPFPQTKPYDTGFDYDEIIRIQYEKEQNKPYWEKCNTQQEYCDNGNLYSGHLQVNNKINYYIVDSPMLKSRCPNDRVHFYLVNADDKKNFGQILEAWQYPNNYKDVTLSRNIVLRERHVEDVDVKLDDRDSLFSNISDAYLRKALIRNKNHTGIQSIIQTIQRKQDTIRSLPAKDSFIVQGCAGSGKTMVLLHRIRYLLYNEEITDNQFIFLVPSASFKSFIKDISRDFKIPEKSIFPYQAYYQYIVNKEKITEYEDSNELLFDDEYLSFVYSKSFVQDSYSYLFDFVKSQTDKLIEYCDSVLSAEIEIQTTQIEESSTDLQNLTIINAKKLSISTKGFISVNLETIDDIQNWLQCAEKILHESKEKLQSVAVPDEQIVISDDDERIISNVDIQKLSDDIISETNNIAKASIFTAQAHQNKLRKLRQKYSELLETVKNKIIDEVRIQRAEKVKQLSYVYEGVTLETFETIVVNMQAIYQSYCREMQLLVKKRESIQETVGIQYSGIITLLNTLIEYSSDIDEISKEYIESLLPAYSYLNEYIRCGCSLLNEVLKQEQRGKTEKVREKFRFFNEKTELQSQSYLNTILFNYCRRKIKDRYNITVSKLYKHYWYLELYCQYLTRDLTAIKKYPLIFIDECQDLSSSEIELIWKLNTVIEHSDKKNMQPPILNAFGDINQVISHHGVNQWDEIKYISKIYELRENFRNTNQIVDYCNHELPFSMQKIGVDMEKVDIFDTVLHALLEGTSLSKNPIIIVKDDYSKKDLSEEMSLLGQNNYICYTVKEVKGLEFKEVFVVERDMSIHEKYIAYTRALVKLIIIKKMDYYVDHKEKLYHQGDDFAENPIKELT